MAKQPDQSSSGISATDKAATTLAQPKSASADKESVTAGLRGRSEAIQLHKQALVSQIHTALSPPRHTSAFAQTQDVDQLFQTAVGRFAELLQGLTEAAQQLPDADNPSSGASAEWGTAAFKANTIHVVLATCFSASADAPGYSISVGADKQADTDALDRCMLLLSSCFEAATEAWADANVSPKLLHQLKATSVDSTSKAGQDEHALPNGKDEDLLQGLDSLSLQDAALTTDLPKPNARQGQSANDVPCDDSDCFLEATGQTREWPLERSDQTLESDLHNVGQTLESGMEGDADTQQSDAFTTKGELVPYSGFDEALAGADETLELEEPSQSPTDSASILTYTGSSSNDQRDETQQSASSQSERLSTAMLQYLHCAGTVATAEQQEAAVAAAQAELDPKAEALHTHELLVAFEWVYEPELVKVLQAGLGQPPTISPKASLTPQHLYCAWRCLCYWCSGLCQICLPS